MLQQLHIVTAFSRVLALQADVGVSGDDARQKDGAGLGINGLSAVRHSTAFRDTLDLISADNDSYIVPNLRRGSIDQVRCTDDYQLLRLGGLCGSRDGANEGND